MSKMQKITCSTYRTLWKCKNCILPGLFWRRLRKTKPGVPLSVHPSQSLPNKQVEGCTAGAEEAEGSILQPPLFGPELPSPLAPPLFVPTAERAAPMSPLERNEKKERIAAVTWALFHSPRSPWQRCRDPGSTRPLSLDSVLKAERQLEVSPLVITDYCFMAQNVAITLL